MINGQPYDPEDFRQNPGKYVLFRTARIAAPIDSLPELAVGTAVAIRYFDTRLSAGRGSAEMPIYQIWSDGNLKKPATAMLYAHTLEGFCL